MSSMTQPQQRSNAAGAAAAAAAAAAATSGSSSQQSQAAAAAAATNPPNPTTTSATTVNAAVPVLQRWFQLLNLLLRIVLWPLHRLSLTLFATPYEWADGLSTAVTAKAAQHFATFLQQQQTTQQQQAGSTGTVNTNSTNSSTVWSELGFAAARQEASRTNGLLLIYLHADLHYDCDAFCRRVLLDPAMVAFLAQPNITALGVSIYTAQGAQLASMLSAVSYPLLALLQPPLNTNTNNNTANNNRRTNSQTAASAQTQTMALLFRAEGPALAALHADQMLPHLRAALTRHEVLLAEMEATRFQREQEMELRRQQDEEYLASLAADQEREEQKRLQQEQERLEKERLERQEKEELDRKARKLERAQSLITEEPAAGTPDTSMIRFVLPSGTKLNRRFYNHETIGALKAHCLLHFQNNQINIHHISLSTSFPRRTFHEPEDSITLLDAGLVPQAVLMVQDLDA